MAAGRPAGIPWPLMALGASWSGAARDSRRRCDGSAEQGTQGGRARGGAPGAVLGAERARAARRRRCCSAVRLVGASGEAARRGTGRRWRCRERRGHVMRVGRGARRDGKGVRRVGRGWGRRAGRWGGEAGVVLCAVPCCARGGEEGGGGRKEKEKGKERGRGKEKEIGREKERGREIAPAPIAAMTANGRARSPVGRDARNEEEQGDGTAIGFGCRDRFFGRLGDRAGDDFGWIELNDEKRFENIFSA